MMTAIIGLLLLMIVALFYLKINQDIKDNILINLAQETKLQANLALNSVLDADDKAADTLTHQLQSTRSIKVAAIFLANGSLLGYYNRNNNDLLPELNPETHQHQTEKDIIYLEPISYRGETIGYFYISHELDILFENQRSYFIYLLLMFLFSLIVAILSAGIFQKLITMPIRRMVRHINAIYRSNDFEKRLVSKRTDELGTLTDEFNQMLDAVQERENELTVHGKQLQRLVEVRTEQLYQKAHFDSLTGLPNRYLLVDRLHQAISKSSRNKAILALLFLDLDRFKVINDNLGHQNGDLLLKEVAKRLSKLSREGDTVARLGGDEFVFLLENLNTAQEAAITARRIIDSFKVPFRLQEYILHVSTSIGISIFPEDGADDKTLLKNADISMYHAKEKGPGKFSFYTQDMNESSLERLSIEGNLRSAIDKQEFYLVYQPQMRLKDNQFKNVEALLRWKNDEVGEISPGVFIPIAEETGLINQIDLWVITQACQQIKLWKEQGLTDITVAINISAGHLISDSLLVHLKRQILLNQVNPRQIEIEITEAVFVEHTERTIKTLQAIKKLGAKIAIDDFGTGYSSLQYIQNFPADTLKLDGMFITDLSRNTMSQGIVRSTVILAHSLGLELVVECVEDQYQLDFLREQKCDLVQGFLLSKPLMPQEILVFCSS